MINIIMKLLNDPNVIFDMMLHGLLLFTFLTLFFSFYISKTSEKVFNEEINNLFDNTINDKLNNINSMIKQSHTIQNVVDSIPLDTIKNHYNDKDTKVNSMNQGILHSIWTANIILWVCFIIGVYLLHDKYDLHIKDIFTENIIIFILIGAAEYLFFTRIGLNFIPVEPSFISKQILETSKKIF